MSVSLSRCLPYLLPLLSLSLACPVSLSLSLSLSPSVDLCLTIPAEICNAKSKQAMVSWLWWIYRTIKNKKSPFSLPEIFPSAKPLNNTGIFLFWNYSSVLNLTLIPSHALNIALLAMHACILLYKIVRSALWFLWFYTKSDQGLEWCTLVLL